LILEIARASKMDRFVLLYMLRRLAEFVAHMAGITVGTILVYCGLLWLWSQWLRTLAP